MSTARNTGEEPYISRMRGVWLLFTIGLAQLYDDFSDGDFTNNPPWSGTDAYWMVTVDKRLRSNGPSATATLYLSTPNALLDNTEWRFWVRVAFNPSTNNFARVYLVADRADLTDPALNGYYLRLGGISGNLDSLELWRQQGSTHTKLAGGIPGRFGGTNNILWIRVLRDNAGTWEVYSDSLGYWQQEFVVNDAVLTSTSYFGVYFQHTSSNRQNLWFDDFYIGPPIVDTIPPTLSSVEVVSPTLLHLQFSEAVELASAQNPANYTLAPGTWTITAAVRPMPSIVELTLGQPLQPSVVYTLTYSGISDMDGNVGSGTLPIVLPEAPQPGDLILSEIMAKPTPTVGLPPYEYVEVYNRSAKWLQVRGVKFCDANTCGTLPTRVLEPGGYLLLAPATALSVYDTLQPIAPSTWPTLNDSGDSLSLLTADDELLDKVQYQSSWYRDPQKAQGGWSLERIDLNDLCSADSNWIASIHPNGGTPRAPNSVAGIWSDQTPPRIIGWELLSASSIRVSFSEPLDTVAMQNPLRYAISGGGLSITSIQVAHSSVDILLSAPLQGSFTYTLTVVATDCMGNQDSLSMPLGLPQPGSKGDLVFSEIMAKPTPAVGLPAYEYVELHNRSQKWLQLTGMRFCDGSACATLPARAIAPGAYLLLVPSGAVGVYPDAVGLSPWPTLNDSGDSLTLLSPVNEVLESVQYTSAWYRNPQKAQGGWSLERIDLDDLCNTDSNWIASTAPSGGTPGAPNSVAGIWRDQSPPTLRAVSFRASDRMLLHFSEAVDTVLMRTPHRYRILSGPAIQSVQIWTPDEVELHLSTPLSPSTDYTLEVEATDCRGNDTLLRYPFGLPEPAAPFDVVITEIMADPDPPVGLPPYEYVEIYNRSQKYIQLEGWLIQIGATQRRLPHHLLRPGGYITLAAPDGALALALYGQTLGIPSFPAIPNRSGTIVLQDSTGQAIDMVSYTSAWYADSEKDDGGWSLERIWTDWLCGGQANWRASIAPNGGTPSAPNSIASTAPYPSPAILKIIFTPPSVYAYFSERMDTLTLMNPAHYQWSPSVPLIAATPIEGGFGVELLPMVPLEENRTYTLTIVGLRTCAGGFVDTLRGTLTVPARPEPHDLIINEILPEPQTGGVRYVELYNRSDKVIDITQLMLARGQSPYSFREVSGEAPFLLYPQQYICLTPDTQDVKGRYLPPPHARFYQIKSIPAYDYRQDTVWLMRRSDSVVVDRVPYASSYHFPDLRSRKGVALERLSPDRPSDEPQNWYSAASAVQYGTPGYTNSQREVPTDGTGIYLEPKTISPDGDGYDDMLWIVIPVEAPDTRAEITIHTLSGHKVRTLVENELLAVGENKFRWEGTDSDGRRLPAGIYIVSIRLIEPTRGKAQHYRLPCAIAEKIR